jgi:hypothetical protein
MTGMVGGGSLLTKFSPMQKTEKLRVYSYSEEFMQEFATPKLASLFGVLWVSALLIFASWSKTGATPPELVGGPCDYKRYAGLAEIVSVTRIGEAQGKSQDEYDVKFLFHPRDEITESFAQVTGRELPLLTERGSHLQGHFIEEYDIRVGRQIECNLMVIIRGACTPVMFEFPWTGRGGE